MLRRRDLSPVSWKSWQKRLQHFSRLPKPEPSTDPISQGLEAPVRAQTKGLTSVKRIPIFSCHFPHFPTISLILTHPLAARRSLQERSAVPGPVERQQEFRDSDTSENPIPQKKKKQTSLTPSFAWATTKQDLRSLFPSLPGLILAHPPPDSAPKPSSQAVGLQTPEEALWVYFLPQSPYQPRVSMGGVIYSLLPFAPYFFHRFQPCRSCSVLLLTAFLFRFLPFASKPCFLWVCLMEPVPRGCQG